MSRRRNYDDRRRQRDKQQIPDHFTMRVPMMAMDSVQRAVAGNFDWHDDRPLATDAFGDSSAAALRRPGYRLMTGDVLRDAQAEAAKARQQYLDDLTSAWQGDNKRNRPDEDEDKDDEDEDEEFDDEAGNQEGARARGGRRRSARRRLRTQHYDPQGREVGTSTTEVEEDFEDRLRRAQADRRRATDKAYAAAEQDLRDAYKNWK